MNFFSKSTILLLTASFILSESSLAGKIKLEENDTPSTIIRKMRDDRAKEIKKKEDKERAKEEKKAKKKGKKKRTTKQKQEKSKKNKITKKLKNVKHKKKSSTKNAKDYTLTVKELPKDLKRYQRLIFEKKKKIHATPAQIRNILTNVEKIEQKMPSLTEKLCDVMQSAGYVANNKTVKVKSSQLAKSPNTSTLVELLKIRDPNFKKGDLKGTCSQSEMIEELQKILKFEDGIVGITQKVRNWLKEKHGFEG